ncbi:MAG TPA: major capsid protein [Gemmatimonadales bacterium]|nr:major capsid protein [Gemmatimonadales bacterium]
MPSLDFGAAIAELTRQGGGVDPAFRIINQARPANDYLLASFFPERQLPSYFVRAGAMTIRPTMAGLVGADSPYPPTGLADIATFIASTAKIANTVPVTEMFLRDLHAFLATLGSDQQRDEAVLQFVLNFSQKMLAQPHMDRMELLRGEMITTGAIDWTFVGKNLAVDYGIPAGNKLTHRTGNDAYHGSASKWWTDYRAGRAILQQRVLAALAHPDTIEAIISNTVNNVILTAQDLATGTVSFVRNTGTLGTAQIPSSDVRERTTLVGYGKEGEILDPDNPGETIAVPFFPRGKVVLLGQPGDAGTGEGLGGATEDEQTGLELGYTHIGPTTESGGALGRWARVFKPEARPQGMQGDAVTNGLPVLRAPRKVVILSTEMPA